MTTSVVEEGINKLTRQLQIAGSAYFTWKNINSRAAADTQVHRALNEHAGFWNIALHSLQSTFFLAVGRLFDSDKSAFSVDWLLKLCTDNISEFSKLALERRKWSNGPRPNWLDDYIANAYEPVPGDFQRLRGKLKGARNKYESGGREIRNKVFAHAEHLSSREIKNMFSQVKINQLESILDDVYGVEEAIRSAFSNGEKPEFKPTKYKASQFLLGDIDQLTKHLSSTLAR